MKRNEKRLRGFTLIELLVVIAIIAVLVALLLPAVQQAREAARRSQCKNNMKQLGIAFHDYHGTHGCWPLSSCPPWDRVANWRAHVLPFIDQQTLYEKLNFNGPSFAGNQGVGVSVNVDALSNYIIAGYVCPSSTLDPCADLTNNSRRIQTPMYVGIAGATPDVSGATVGSNSNYGGFYANNGPLPHNEIKRERDITDGTTNTIIIAEQSGKIGTQDIRSGYYGGYTGTTFGGAISASNPNGADSWSSGLTTVQYAINSPTTAGGSDRSWDANTVINSFHVGGVHVLLSDGGVKFMSDNTDFGTIRNMCSRNDGVPLSSGGLE